MQELSIRLGDLSARVNNSNTELEKQVNYLTRQLRKFEKDGSISVAGLQLDNSDVLEDRIARLEEELDKRQSGKIDLDLRLETVEELGFALEEKAVVHDANSTMRVGLKLARENFLTRLDGVLSGAQAGTANGDETKALLPQLETMARELGFSQNSAKILIGKLERPNDSSTSQYSRNQVISALIAGSTQMLEPVKGLEVEATKVEGSPKIILIVGSDGSGKTALAGRLAGRFNVQGKKVLLASTAPYTGTLAKEITSWAERKGIVTNLATKDSKSTGVAYKSVHKAQDQRCDVVIIDVGATANDPAGTAATIGEVAKMIGREQLYAPHEIILTYPATDTKQSSALIEALAGQVNLTGACLTKLDQAEALGPPLEELLTHQLAIKYLSLGSSEEHLTSFDPANLTAALFSDGSPPEPSSPALSISTSVLEH